MQNPQKTLILRDYQSRAIQECSEQLRTFRRVCLVASTGAGKTLCAVGIIQRALAMGKRVLFIAHRKELLEQCYDKLIEYGVPENDISLLRANDKRFRPNARVTVASMQTLAARMMTPDADIVFIDECHTSASKSYTTIISRYPTAYIIGLTATPIRGRRGLKGYFDKLIIVAKPRQLIEGGHILETEILTVPSEWLPETAMVHTVTSASGEQDFNQKELAAACEKWDIVGHIPETYLKYGNGRKAICFAASVKSSMMVVEALTAKGIRAFHIDSNNDKQRVEGLRKLKFGEIDVLSNVGILCEGWDAPYVKVLIMARPTQSLVVFLQQVGRIVRPYGSETALILDHAGNVQRHGFPDADIDWKLDTMPRERVSIKRCPQCWAANPALTKICRNAKCGPPPYTWTKEEQEQVEREIEIAEGRLAKAQRPTTCGDPVKDRWNALCREAIADAKKEKWARVAFKKEFGEWPSESTYKFPIRPEASWDDKKRRKKWDQLRAAAHATGQGGEWAADKFETLFGETVDALHARENHTQSVPHNTQEELDL